MCCFRPVNRRRTGTVGGIRSAVHNHCAATTVTSDRCGGFPVCRRGHIPCIELAAACDMQTTRRILLGRTVTDCDLCVILHENGILVRACGSDRLSLNRLVTGVGIGCGVLRDSAGGVWLVDVSVVAACASVFPLLITALPATADTATPAASAIANSFLFPLNLRIIIICTCLSEQMIPALCRFCCACVCLLFFVLKAGYNMNLKWGLSLENFCRGI